jgi:uncharacterized protein (DUF433 family)
MRRPWEAPIVAGTRIQADVIIDYFDHRSSTEKILRNYPGLSLETIEKLIAFAQSQRMQFAS